MVPFPGGSPPTFFFCDFGCGWGWGCWWWISLAIVAMFPCWRRSAPLLLLLVAGTCATTAFSGSRLPASYCSNPVKRTCPTKSKWCAQQYKVFFDVKTLDEPVGRMVFTIEQGNLQRSVENFKTLVAGSRRSLDPMLSYLGCEFAFGPQYVLQVRPSTRVVAMVHGGYRWGGMSCRFAPPRESLPWCTGVIDGVSGTSGMYLCCARGLTCDFMHENTARWDQ